MQSCPEPPFGNLKAELRARLRRVRSNLAVRARRTYSVHIVPRNKLPKPRLSGQALGFDAIWHKVDVSHHLNAGGAASGNILEDIVRKFSASCHFVVVFGLYDPPDDLLKWLCEFTDLHPWRTIWLIDADITFKLPENLDRCNTSHAAGLLPMQKSPLAAAL